MVEMNRYSKGGSYAGVGTDPLKVRSRKGCELIHILGHSGEEASAEEERGRRRRLLQGATSPHIHTPSPFTLFTLTELQEEVCREIAGLCAGWNMEGLEGAGRPYFIF